MATNATALPEERLSFGCLLVPTVQTKRAKCSLEARSLLDKRFKIFPGPDGLMALPVTEQYECADPDPTLQEILLLDNARFDPLLCAPALVPRPPERPLPGSPDLVRVVELFAGVGGFRLGCEAASTPAKRFRVVFGSEIDPWARRTYQANFGPEHCLTDILDITATPSENVPPHDLLTAGFPCQPFSGLGKRKGVNEPRGRLFMQIVRLAKAHRPKVLLLENVVGLLSIDGGAAIEQIVQSLEEAGYTVSYHVYNSSSFGLAQHRERVYFVCIANPEPREFQWPEPPNTSAKLCEVLDEVPDPGCSLSEHQWSKVQAQPYFKQHPEARLADPNGHTQTLTSNYKAGYLLYSQFVPVGEGQPPRFLSVRECSRLMGFPEGFKVGACGNQGQFYRQIGNAVCPQVIQHIAMALVLQGFL